MAKDDDKRPLIIIKRVKKIDGGHHGGAWKVAYADFVTAMMAFFLLLWLLSVTTKEAKQAISSYFSPADPRISQAVSGSGGVMGGTTLAQEGAQTDTTAPPVEQPGETAESKEASEEEKLAKKLDAQDQKAFDDAQDKIKKAIESSPELKDLAQNLIIDMTPEGLRIQIVDQEGRPMFELGSARPMPAAEKLLAVVTGVVKDLPNQISIRGHTDSKQYGKDASYTNWELSSDRANASRRVMLTNHLDVGRIENVQGKADREPLVQNDLESARNRRISLILLKQSLVIAEHKKSSQSTPVAAPPPEPNVKKREEGVIYFP